jgi:hypothetical protein
MYPLHPITNVALLLIKKPPHGKRWFFYCIYFAPGNAKEKLVFQCKIIPAPKSNSSGNGNNHAFTTIHK